jgi:hypothetical protein
MIIRTKTQQSPEPSWGTMAVDGMKAVTATVITRIR